MTLRNETSAHWETDSDQTFFLSISDMFIGFLFVFIILLGSLAMSSWEESVKLRAKINEWTERNAYLDELVKQKELQKSDLELDNARLSVRIAALEEELRNRGFLLKSLQAKLSTAEEAIMIAGSTQTTLLKKLDDLKQRNDLHMRLRAEDADTLREYRKRHRRLNQTLRFMRAELSREQQKLSANYDQVRTLLHNIRQRLAAEGINDVTIGAGGTVLRLPGKLLFDRGQAEMRPGGRPALRRVAEILAELLPCYIANAGGKAQHGCPSGTRDVINAVYIEGHTDDVSDTSRSGARFENNWELSALRAASAFRHLMQAAPRLKAMNNNHNQPILGLSAYADSRPIAMEQSEQAREQNRRIDFRFLVATPKGSPIPENLQAND